MRLRRCWTNGYVLCTENRMKLKTQPVKIACDICYSERWRSSIIVQFLTFSVCGTIPAYRYYTQIHFPPNLVRLRSNVRNMVIADCCQRSTHRKAVISSFGWATRGLSDVMESLSNPGIRKRDISWQYPRCWKSWDTLSIPHSSRSRRSR